MYSWFSDNLKVEQDKSRIKGIAVVNLFFYSILISDCKVRNENA